MVKNLPAMQETWVQFLGWEDPLEKGMATHSSILAWRISMDRVWRAIVHGVTKRHDWETKNIYTPVSKNMRVCSLHVKYFLSPSVVNQRHLFFFVVIKTQPLVKPISAFWISLQYLYQGLWNLQEDRGTKTTHKFEMGSMYYCIFSRMKRGLLCSKST